MKIVDIREVTKPISSSIRNAYIDFSKMTASLVAVVTDVVRDGRRVVGYGFNSNGRYGQGGLIRERFRDRILEEKTLDWLLERANIVEPSADAPAGDPEMKAVAEAIVEEQVAKKSKAKKAKAAEEAPAAAAAAPAAAAPAAKAPGGGMPLGKLQVLNGPIAGKELELTKALITLGKPGTQVAVISRRPQGYFLTHIEGDGQNDNFPVVNSKAIGPQAYAIQNGDIIELAGIKMEFNLVK